MGAIASEPASTASIRGARVDRAGVRGARVAGPCVRGPYFSAARFGAASFGSARVLDRRVFSTAPAIATSGAGLFAPCPSSDGTIAGGRSVRRRPGVAARDTNKGQSQKSEGAHGREPRSQAGDGVHPRAATWPS